MKTTRPKRLRKLDIMVQRLCEGNHEPSLPTGTFDEMDRFLRKREKVDTDARRRGKEKAEPILKHFIDPEIVKVIINIWELMAALTKDIDGQPQSNVVSEDQTVGDVYRYFHERHGPARTHAENASLALWLEKSEKRFTTFRARAGFRPIVLQKRGYAPWSMASWTRMKQKHQELLNLSAKYVAFAATREPRCTIKNVLELTITGKIKQIPIIPDALIAASIALGCVLFLHARLKEIFGGSDRERVGYVGGDKTIVRELKHNSTTSTRRSLSWQKRGSRSSRPSTCTPFLLRRAAKETANRLLWESFIVLWDNQTTDEQHQRAFTSNLLYSKDDTKKFIDIFDENFGEEGTPAWWRISGKAHVAPEPKAMPKPGVPPSASSSGDTTGRAPWRASCQPTGKTRDDG